MNVTVGFQILAFPIEGRKRGESFLQISINGEQKIWLELFSLEPSATFRHDRERIYYTAILFKNTDIQTSGDYNRSPASQDTEENSRNNTIRKMIFFMLFFCMVRKVLPQTPATNTRLSIYY